MKLLKTRWFTRFARHERITDALLTDAIDRAERGLVDADLGGGLIKQRVARPGEGRRGGYRVLVGYRRGARAIFLFGFRKSDFANIAEPKLVELRELGAFWLEAADTVLAKGLAAGTIMEVILEKNGEGSGG